MSVDRLKKQISDKLAAEGGGTWAAYMMIEIEQLVSVALGDDLELAIERRAIALATASNDIWDELEEYAVGEPSKRMYRQRVRQAIAQ
jgi:hypothetical protein